MASQNPSKVDGKVEFVPGVAVWVRIPRHPWWPALVVSAAEVPEDVTRFYSKKAPLAYVRLIPENVFEAVTKKNLIRPFNTPNKESLIEAGQAVKKKNVRLRLEFDCGVKAVERHMTNQSAMDEGDKGSLLPRMARHSERLSASKNAKKGGADLNGITKSCFGQEAVSRSEVGSSGKDLRTPTPSKLSTNNPKITPQSLNCNYDNQAQIENDNCESKSSSRILEDTESDGGSSSQNVLVRIKRELYEENYRPHGNKGVTNTLWSKALGAQPNVDSVSPSCRGPHRSPESMSGLYRCDICSFTTQRLGNMVIHQRMHSSEAKKSGQLLVSMYALSQPDRAGIPSPDDETTAIVKRQLSFTCPTPPHSVCSTHSDASPGEEHTDIAHHAHSALDCGTNVPVQELPNTGTKCTCEKQKKRTVRRVSKTGCLKCAAKHKPENGLQQKKGVRKKNNFNKTPRKKTFKTGKRQRTHSLPHSSFPSSPKAKRKRGSLDPNVMPDACDSSSSDDELPDVFSSSQEKTAEKIGQGELAWVQRWRYPFWPALVKKVYKRKKQLVKATVIFLGTPEVEAKDRKLTVCYNPKTVLPFGGQHKRHAMLKSEGESSTWASEFKPAVQKAEDFLWKKCLGETPDAFTFFKEDLSGETYEWSEEENDTSTLYSPPASEEEERQREEQSDTEVEVHVQVGKAMSTALQKKIEKSKERSKLLIDFMKRESTKKHLSKICQGIWPSWRHNLFHKPGKSRDEIFNLKRQGFGPIDDEDQRMEVFDVLTDHMKSLGLAGSAGSHLEYLWQVLAPEAIVFALRKARHLSQERAEAAFKQGVRRTKEECRRFREEIIQSSRNIDEEDRVRYNNKILMRAAALLK